jgi:hypothetical protein
MPPGGDAPPPRLRVICGDYVDFRAESTLNKGREFPNQNNGFPTKYRRTRLRRVFTAYYIGKRAVRTRMIRRASTSVRPSTLAGKLLLP